MNSNKFKHIHKNTINNNLKRKKNIHMVKQRVNNSVIVL